MLDKFGGSEDAAVAYEHGALELTAFVRQSIARRAAEEPQSRAAEESRSGVEQSGAGRGRADARAARNGAVCFFDARLVGNAGKSRKWRGW